MTLRADNRRGAIFEYVLNRRELAETVEEMVAGGGDQFLRLAAFSPCQPDPFLRRVPIQPHHFARHQGPPAKFSRRGKAAAVSTTAIPALP
jgi:hypothetical protein